MQPSHRTAPIEPNWPTGNAACLSERSTNSNVDVIRLPNSAQFVPANHFADRWHGESITCEAHTAGVCATSIHLTPNASRTLYEA